MTDRHLLSVRVPVAALAEMIARNASMLLDDGCPVPFPDEMEYIRAYHDPETDALMLVFEHESFPPTTEGAMIQRVHVVTTAAPKRKEIPPPGYLSKRPF